MKILSYRGKFWCICLLIILVVSCNGKKIVNVNDVFSHPMVEMPTGFVAGKPDEVTNMSAEVLMNQIYDPLFIYDENLNLKPILIDSWEMSKDNNENIFYIKKGILFHNRKELTAEDVIYSIEYTSKYYSRNNKFLNSLGTDSILKKCGKYCFKISTGNAYPQFANIFSGSYYKIIPKDSIKVNIVPPGTGPFKIQKWGANEILLERFDGYREKVQSSIKYCHLRHMSKRDAIEAYKNKEVDDLLEYSLSKNELSQLSGTNIEMPTYIFNYIAFNVQMPPFNNPQIRLALQYGIDRNKLYKKYFSEHLPIYGIVPKGLVGSGAGEFYPYSPKLAKKLLNSINMKNKDVELWIRNQDWDTEFVEDLVGQMEDLGFKIRVRHESDDKFYDSYFARKQQMFFITLGADYKDADSILSSFSSVSSDNDVGIDDRRIDVGLSDLSSIYDKNKRNDKIREIEKLIMGHNAIIPIYQRVASTIYSNSISKIKLTSSWHEDIRIGDYIKEN